jgi:hypothetical protein
MRHRTKLPISKPGRSEFKNFDRLMDVLLKAKPRKLAPKTKVESERPTTDQEDGRERLLPRP